MRAELKELQVHRGVEAGLELFIYQSDQFSLSQVARRRLSQLELQRHYESRLMSCQ